MDLGASGRLVDPSEFPGVVFGVGVVLYGKVCIEPQARIGDYSIIGIPAVYDLADPDSQLTTRLGPSVLVGPHCIIHSGASLGARVRLDDRCTVGPESQIGEDTRILYGAQIYWHVSLGRGCVVAGFCCDRATVGDRSIMLGKLIHRLEHPSAPWDEVEEPSPRIQHEAVVGYDALIIGEVVVHSKAYVAAGAIVTRDVPSGMLVRGCHPYSREKWDEKKRRAHEEDED